jgi:hypothetical protein
MGFIVTCVIVAFAFFLGRTSARVETALTFKDQLLLFVTVIIKVDQLLAFSGKSIKDLSAREVIEKVQQQLDLMNHGK